MSGPIFSSGDRKPDQGPVYVEYSRIAAVLTLFCLLFVLFAPQTFAQTAPEPNASVPGVYRLRCVETNRLEEELRARYAHEPGFSLTIRKEREPDVFRIVVLASEPVQRDLPELLQRHGVLLPRESDGAVVSIAVVPQDTSAPVPAQAERSASPGRPSIDESRDSFTATHVPLSKIEQTLLALLGARANEISPGRYWISVRCGEESKHCTLEVDREHSRFLLIGEKSLCAQLVRLIDAIDRPEPPQGRERRFVSLTHVGPETVSRLLEISRSPGKSGQSVPDTLTEPVPPLRRNATAPDIRPPLSPAVPTSPTEPRIEFRPDVVRQSPKPLPKPRRDDGVRSGVPAVPTSRHLDPRRNPVIQLVGYRFQGEGAFDGDAASGGTGPSGRPGSGGPSEAAGPGMEVVADFRYQILPDLDVLIIDATGAEVARFVDMIKQIEELSRIAEPKIEVYFLKHVNCISLNWVIFQVYVDLFRTKQGTVKVIPLIHPNAMLLVGWGHSLEAMKDLIETLDKPIATEHGLLQVIRLQHASAQYVLSVLRGTFPVPPIQNSGFSPRIQMIADSRTNSIIVQAGPNDLKEIKRLVAELDVSGAGPKLRIKSFKLKHTLATDLAQVLTDAIAPGTAGTQDRKLPALELLVIDEKGRRMIESGIMSDVRISRDVRNNTVIVTAPEHCMPLLEELIAMLDMPAATAEIKVFQILYGDANSMIKTLQSLIPTQLEGQVGPQLPGAKDEDALVPVRFAVDTRTNSILAAGAPNDLKIVEALLYSLDREDRQTRRQTVYMLKSMQAQDVSVAINEYIRSKRLIQQGAPGVVSPYQQIESEVIVIPEHVSNTLIVSATPRYYDEIIELIKEIDKAPPQVVIQVLIGEVTLSNVDEFGAEFGIQDSLLFNRSTFESITEGTRKITRTENGITTVIEEPVILNGTAKPGWLFNESPSTSLASGYNTQSSQDVGNVGSQLLTNFATGRLNAEAGFGGMVFSANSDAVSIMIRALQETGRIEILSRPQITAMNNQRAMIHVGQLVPRFAGTVDSNYNSRSSVEEEMVGLMLIVTPSISPEGNVVMAVAAEKSKIGAENVVVGYSDGQAVTSPVIDRIHTMTMVSAADNETVVLGGMITKENQEIRRKVPLLGDIPIVGKLFSYEYNKCRRTELLIIMTPRIIRDGCDMEHVKQVEAARMNWCLGGVARLHGDIGTYDNVAEQPYAGDAVVVFPEAVDLESLSPVLESPMPDTTGPTPEARPRLAPPPEPAQPSAPRLPTPVLPGKKAEPGG